jgi:hypothetical protein
MPFLRTSPNILWIFFGKQKKYHAIFRWHRIQRDYARVPFVTPTAFKNRQKVHPRASRRLGYTGSDKNIPKKVAGISVVPKKRSDIGAFF